MARPRVVDKCKESRRKSGVQMKLGQVLPLPSVQVPSLLLLSSGNHTPNKTAVPTSSPLTPRGASADGISEVVDIPQIGKKNKNQKWIRFPQPEHTPMHENPCVCDLCLHQHGSQTAKYA